MDDLHQALLLQPQHRLLERGLSDKFQYTQTYSIIATRAIQIIVNKACGMFAQKYCGVLWVRFCWVFFGGFLFVCFGLVCFGGDSVVLVILNICS